MQIEQLCVSLRYFLSTKVGRWVPAALRVYTECYLECRQVYFCTQALNLALKQFPFSSVFLTILFLNYVRGFLYLWLSPQLLILICLNSLSWSSQLPSLLLRFVKKTFWKTTLLPYKRALDAIHLWGARCCLRYWPTTSQLHLEIWEVF